MKNLFIALGAFIVIFASNDGNQKNLKIKNDLVNNDNDNIKNHNNNNNICYIQYLECINNAISNNNNVKNKQEKNKQEKNKQEKEKKRKSKNRKRNQKPT